MKFQVLILGVPIGQNYFDQKSMEFQTHFDTIA